MNSLKEKIDLSDKRNAKNPVQKDVKLPVGTRILWLLNKKEYTKVNTEMPFSKWESLNGGILMIDDNRVLRKDVFTVLDSGKDVDNE